MAIDIRPVTVEELPEILPLIAAYQEFYEVEDIDRDRNLSFFSRFVGENDDGWIHAAWDGDLPVGFACYYLHKSSFAVTDTVLLNDLYVSESVRGQGIGRRFIETGRELARGVGSPVLEWATAPDNTRAQALYDSTGAEKKTWLEYELKV